MSATIEKLLDPVEQPSPDVIEAQRQSQIAAIHKLCLKLAENEKKVHSRRLELISVGY